MIEGSYQKNEPFVKVAKRMGKQYRYPDMYWGSVCFFIELNGKLTASGSSLLEVIRLYQTCCRKDARGVDIDDLMTQWDEITKNKLASDVLLKYQSQPAKEIIHQMKAYL